MRMAEERRKKEERKKERRKKERKKKKEIRKKKEERRNVKCNCWAHSSFDLRLVSSSLESTEAELYSKGLGIFLPI